MTSSNRVALSCVRESTPGVTPVTPRMRYVRMTGEGLAFQPNYVDSDEIRVDRMLGDPILVMKDSSGPVNVEISYPEDNSPLSEFYRSAMFNAWVNTPTFDNDGTADSVITDAGTVANTYSVNSGGAAVKLGHLVQATGFAQAANNQIFRVASSTATTIVGTALSLTAETAPPAAAKLKVIGFQGAAADLTALADGIGSTALDFTTLGLSVGQWIKIGGTLDASTFAFLVTAGAVARAAAWARITAIEATKLTLDNLPTGWTTDAGTGKTIKVFFGDQIKNGVTLSSMTFERGFAGQAVPTYIVNAGMVADTFVHTFASRDKLKGVVNFKGMGGSQGTVSLDASPDAATTNQVLAANANVGRLAEAGSQLTSPNWAKSLEFTINNNLRMVESIDSQSPVAIREGECTVSGKISTYFGDNTLLQKFFNNTATAINARVTKNGQGLIYQFPRVTLRGGGNPSAAGKNQDVMADFDFQSSLDVLTQAHAIIDRVPYFE